MAATDPNTPERCYSSIRLPRPMCFALRVAVLVAVSAVAALADDSQAAPGKQRVAKETAALHPFCKNGKWGYLDRLGRTVIEPGFDYAGRFSEGLAPARKGDIAGYLRTDGSWRIKLPGQISPTRSFREGRVAFLDGDKFGFLDRDGNVLVRAKYDHVTDFRNGRAGILSGYGRLVGGDEPPGGQWGFIDPSGEIVIGNGVGFGSEYSEGLAPTCTGITLLIRGSNPVPAADSAAQSVRIDNPGRQFIDRDGKIALTVNPDLGSPDSFISAVGAFSEGLLAVNGTVIEKRGTKAVAGFVDKSSKTVIGFHFDWARDFSDGVAAVQKSGKWGYIDRRGAWVVCPCFDSADAFHEGLARVQVGTAWHFVDRRGCLVSSTNRDLSGQPVAASPWNETRDFDGGLALVHVGGTPNCDVSHQPCYWEHGVWYYVNQHGTVVSIAWRDDDAPSAWRPFR